MERPFCRMLIGVPCAGKSTAIKNWIFANPSFDIISTDNHIEKEAAKLEKTYSDIFSEYVGVAQNLMYEDIKKAIDGNKSVIWDQTNLSAKQRRAKLMRFPSNYFKEAVVFDIPVDEILKERLALRPGKNIPWFVIENMKKSFEYPTLEEGFDSIVNYSEVYDV